MKNKESLFDTATPSKLRRWALLALVGALAATATVLFSAWPVMAQDPPAKPTGLTGTVAHDGVTLSWADPQDDTITGYQVLRRDKSINGLGDFPVLVDDTGSAAPSFTDTTVIAEGRYTYRVKARNAAGLSSQSGYFDARLPQPPAVTVSFEEATHTVEEGQSVSIGVTLSADPERTVTIPVTVSGQDGASEADYSGAPSEVTFSAGETRQDITLTATDDAADDDGESVLLSLGANLPDRVSAGSVSETTVSIADNDEPEPTSPTQPPAKPTDLTGTVAHNQVALTWDAPQGDTITGYQVLRRDKSIHEPGEFLIHVEDTGSTTPAYTDTSVTAGGKYTYRIKARNAAGLSSQSGYFDAQVPQPPAVTVSFEQATHTVEEGQSVAIGVTLSADPERIVTIPVTVSNLDGASESDHSGVPSEVTFNAGETRQVITLSATDDAADDDGESVLMSFGASLPGRVSAGSVSETTVSITDNDEPEPDPTPMPDPVEPADDDATRDGAIDLGDITGVAKTRYPTYQIDGGDDAVDYFRFAITEPKRVTVGIRQLDADASITIEDADGQVIKTKAKPDAEHVMLYLTLLEGAYYVRVEATETGDNEYRLAHGVREADADKVAKLREEQETPARQPQQTADADVRDDAVDLGDITHVTEARSSVYDIGGGTDAVDWFRFELTESRRVSLVVSEFDADASLTLEDEAGAELASTDEGDSDDLVISTSLDTGVYYAKVEASETDAGTYTFEYSTIAPPSITSIGFAGPLESAPQQFEGRRQLVVREGDEVEVTIVIKSRHNTSYVEFDIVADGSDAAGPDDYDLYRPGKVPEGSTVKVLSAEKSVPGEIRFTGRDTRKSFKIRTHDDDDEEGTEKFIIRFKDQTQDALTVYITDNDYGTEWNTLGKLPRRTSDGVFVGEGRTDWLESTFDFPGDKDGFVAGGFDFVPGRYHVEVRSTRSSIDVEIDVLGRDADRELGSDFLGTTTEMGMTTSATARYQINVPTYIGGFFFIVRPVGRGPPLGHSYEVRVVTP